MIDIAADRNRSGPRQLWIALIAWTIVSLYLLIANWPNILSMDLSDADDAMRMAQVRDLLAGQGWWDLMQYRINPAAGGALMHWSRIVDAPIAGGILLFEPFFGRTMAERIVMTALPPIMGAVLAVACALGFRHVPDRRVAYVAPPLLVMMGFVVSQYRTLHIDHHGWQILLAMIVVWQAIRPSSQRAGVIAGLSAAVLLAISIEGLPMVTLFAGLAAIRWALHGRTDDRARLCGYMGALAAGGLLVQFLTRGLDGLTGSWCDALSAPYLAAFAVSGIAVLAIARLDPASRQLRFALLAGAGLFAALSLVLVDPVCAKGPFATLDPIVRRYWYLGVLEGLPITALTLRDATFVIVPSLLGLAGTLLAWRSSADADARRIWTTLFLALAGAAALSLLVMRSVSTAHVYALPGCAVLLLHAWDRARAVPSALPRVAATALTALLLPLPASVVAVELIGSVVPAARAREESHSSPASFDKICLTPQVIAELERVKPTTLMAPLDMSPSLLFWTHHNVVATGHHRNKDAMSDAIRTFISDPADALPLIRKHRVSLVVFCPTSTDMSLYRRSNVQGLAARLSRDDPPDWLEKVQLSNSTRGLSVWRVKPAA